MPVSSNRWRRGVEPEAFAPDNRPGADALVYCKGCGEALGNRTELSRPRAVITMMCQSCQQIHSHEFMPSPGAETFCYRCGERDEVFQTGGVSPVTYHVCPRCLPDRVARYRSGDFEPPEPAALVEKEA